MAAERAAIQHQSGEPFRAGIDRSSKTRRPRSDDGYVIDAVRIDRPYHAETAGELVFARIAQQLSAWAQNNRQLGGVDVEALDQRFRLRIGLRVQRSMRMAVAAEKILEPKHIAAFRATDDHRSAGARLEQADTAQDQGAHNPLAKLRLRDQQGAKPVRRND